MVTSMLSISRCCNELLLEHITQLERKLNKVQYNRKETLEINPVQSNFASNVLEQSLYQRLSDLQEYQ